MLTIFSYSWLSVCLSIIYLYLSISIDLYVSCHLSPSVYHHLSSICSIVITFHVSEYPTITSILLLFTCRWVYMHGKGMKVKIKRCGIDSFHFYAVSGEQTQVVRLASGHEQFYWWSHLASPHLSIHLDIIYLSFINYLSIHPSIHPAII